VRGAPGFLAACLLAALVPLVPRETRATGTPGFPGWPASFEGQPLHPRDLSAAEASFARQFPGRLAAFHDGSRHVLLRYVATATRRLHPAGDCYRGAGYTVEPRPLRVDPDGRRWGCFEAQKDRQRFLVCESILDGDGRSWSDVSSWYWAATLGRSTGPWWTATVAEPLR
jgi:hypothetical protein